MTWSAVLRAATLMGSALLTCLALDSTVLEMPTPRVRLARGQVDSSGGAAWMISQDPTTAARLGRALFQRAFTAAEGASAPAAAPALSAARPARLDFAPSCLQCHNVPFGEPGAGATAVRDAFTVRSTPHLFGAGALDQLAAILGRDLLAQADRDGDGTIARSEAVGGAHLDTGTGAQVDFGSYADGDGDGRPDLDPAVVVWFVDASGRRLSGGDLRLVEVAGYRLALRAFGAGGPPHAAAGTTLRAAIVGAFALHAGLQAQDHVLIARPQDGGWAGLGAAGVRQVDAGALPDLGLTRDAEGLSLDDPDRDGVCAELLDGDIDVVEWFLTRQPSPRERRELPGYAEGRARFISLGCASCHVPSWRRGTLTVDGLYSDLRSHDLGADFHEPQADGTRLRHFRSAPLWGVAHSAPYGHDGASLDLDAVIRRHGGEAVASARAYAAMSAAEHAEVLAFLRALVLR